MSRLQLSERLRMLAPEDAELLARMERLMSWSRLLPQTTDQRIVDDFRRLLHELSAHRCLQELVTARFDLLTVLAALRRRQRGDPAPARGTPWGHERLLARIEQRWTEPEFGLGQALPWIGSAARLLQKDDPMGLERLLMGTAWQHLSRASEGHYFDFEAVAIYRLRFDLIAYWTGWDAKASKAEFQQLLQNGLGEYSDDHWLSIRIGTAISRQQ